jgi:hypothetical protein
VEIIDAVLAPAVAKRSRVDCDQGGKASDADPSSQAAAPSEADPSSQPQGNHNRAAAPAMHDTTTKKKLQPYWNESCKQLAWVPDICNRV